MIFDAKQKVLIAIYTEYQKDIPDMNANIKADLLGLSQDEFKAAMDKLDNENLINGAKFSRGGSNSIPLAVFIDNLKMTSKGIDYVEEKLQVNRTLTGTEKIKKIANDSASWGWEQFKDITSRTLAELIKN